MNDDTATITYVGHATTLIEIDGLRVLTDPIFRNRVLHLQRRGGTTPERDWIAGLDAVLISHLHWDHVDLPSLDLLDPVTPLLVPSGSGALFRKQGFADIREMEIGQRLTLGALTIEAVFAEHDGGRLFSGLNAASQGFLLHGSQTIYFAGDTDLFTEMDAISDSLDIALLPVWGWGPTLGPGHLNPYRAALALRMLTPRVAIPIHWGTFHPIGLQYLRPSFLNDPPRSFARFARQLAPGVQVSVIEPGRSLQVHGSSQGDHHPQPPEQRRP